MLRASVAGEPSLALSAIERPSTAPGSASSGALSTMVLPSVIDKNLVIDWDIDKVPRSHNESLGLEKRSHLAKSKIVQQYQTQQQPAARALKEESMQASPTAKSRAAASLPPAEVKHVQHPLNEHWPEDRIARIDRLSMPTAVRLRQVTQRRVKTQPQAVAPATAYSAHTAVAAAKIYASGHKGWQSRKTPWTRSDKQKQSAQRQLEGHSKASVGGRDPAYPAEWEQRVETLAAQFEGQFSKAEVIEALIHLDGHAGKVARLLRGGISDTAFQAKSPTSTNGDGEVGAAESEFENRAEV
eukprot:COSAG02_NODE_4933_length_4818_cov_2.172706_2_plen_299_part_00